MRRPGALGIAMVVLGAADLAAAAGLHEAPSASLAALFARAAPREG